MAPPAAPPAMAPGTAGWPVRRPRRGPFLRRGRGSGHPSLVLRSLRCLRRMVGPSAAAAPPTGRSPGAGRRSLRRRRPSLLGRGRGTRLTVTAALSLPEAAAAAAARALGRTGVDGPERRPLQDLRPSRPRRFLLVDADEPRRRLVGPLVVFRRTRALLDRATRSGVLLEVLRARTDHAPGGVRGPRRYGPDVARHGAALAYDFVERDPRGDGNVQRAHVAEEGKRGQMVAALADEAAHAPALSPQDQRHGPPVIDGVPALLAQSFGLLFRAD